MKPIFYFDCLVITLSCEFLYGFYLSYFPQNTNYLPNLGMCPAILIDY